MSLILTILVLQIAIHALGVVGSQAINDLVRPSPSQACRDAPSRLDDSKNSDDPSQLWSLFIKLPTSQSRKAATNNALRGEVVKLNRDMSNTSAQDDFAKWAKLRRQHDKKKETYDSNGEARHA